jgi:hypothetical protein
MPVHAGMYRRYLTRIERRAQIDAFNHRGEFVSDRVESHGHLRAFANIQYNAFGARPSRGLGNVGVGLMADSTRSIRGGSEVRIILARGAKPADLPVERMCYHFRQAPSLRSSGALAILIGRRKSPSLSRRAE